MSQHRKTIKRRTFLTLLSGAAIGSPSIRRAQPAAARRIGFISGGSPYEWAPFVAAFREGLTEMGYVEGRNASIEFHWTLGDRDQAPVAARALAKRPVEVIVASGGNPPTRACLQATSTIPIVAVFGEDPVKRKMVANLQRPGGNVTGVSLASPDIEIKSLKFLRAIVPQSTRVGFIMDPEIPASVELGQSFETAVRQLGLQGVVIPGRVEAEIDEVFATLGERGVEALLVASTAYFLDRRDRFVALAARYKIPAIYTARAYVDAGGLVSYGIDRLETYRQLGRYTGAILRGSVPAEMPVLPPSKFELAINLNAAKALGVTFPQSLMTLADIVIR